MNQDSITVFQNPVDSTRVAAQDVTSEKVLNLLDYTEQLNALWQVMHLEYIALVCVSYYIIVTRVQFIKTNSLGRRNVIMFVLTVVWGAVIHYWREAAFYSVVCNALFVNAAYEYIFKRIFRVLERFGWAPLPGWHVEEIKQEKQADIDRAESLKK
jgi:K+-sensing histidine kinase KdpD